MLSSVTDLRRLQWVATQSFDCIFIPCMLAFDQYPRIHPPEVLVGEAASKFCQISVSSAQLDDTLHTLERMRNFELKASYCILVRVDMSLDQLLFQGWVLLKEWLKRHEFSCSGTTPCVGASSASEHTIGLLHRYPHVRSWIGQT